LGFEWVRGGARQGMKNRFNQPLLVHQREKKGTKQYKSPKRDLFNEIENSSILYSKYATHIA